MLASITSIPAFKLAYVPGLGEPRTGFMALADVDVLAGKLSEQTGLSGPSLADDEDEFGAFETTIRSDSGCLDK